MTGVHALGAKVTLFYSHGRSSSKRGARSCALREISISVFLMVTHTTRAIISVAEFVSILQPLTNASIAIV